MHATRVILSVLAIAGSALAVPQKASQYTDGQVQVYPTPTPTVSPVNTSSPAPPPAYGTTTTVVTTSSSSSTAGPVSTTTCTTSTVVPSYPVSGNQTVGPTETGPTGYGGPTTEVSPTTASTSLPVSPNHNAAGVVGVQMGLTGAAVVGLMAFFA